MILITKDHTLMAEESVPAQCGNTADQDDVYGDENDQLFDDDDDGHDDDWGSVHSSNDDHFDIIRSNPSEKSINQLCWLCDICFVINTLRQSLCRQCHTVFYFCSVNWIVSR